VSEVSTICFYKVEAIVSSASSCGQRGESEHDIILTRNRQVRLCIWYRSKRDYRQALYCRVSDNPKPNEIGRSICCKLQEQFAKACSVYQLNPLHLCVRRKGAEHPTFLHLVASVSFLTFTSGPDTSGYIFSESKQISDKRPTLRSIE
jgi:hypothetical protein